MYVTSGNKTFKYIKYYINYYVCMYICMYGCILAVKIIV